MRLVPMVASVAVLYNSAGQITPALHEGKMSMKRILVLLAVVALMVGMLAGAVAASPGSNAANAAKCDEGGYLDYTDAQGNPFKNEGQCTRYAARGGQLVPVPDISLDQAAGTISGTGFTPNSTVVLVVNMAWSTESGSGRISSRSSLSTDGTGAFFASGFDFCPTSSDTSVDVSATDSAGHSAGEFTVVDCG